MAVRIATFQADLDTMVLADKKLDKDFKVRKEFANNESQIDLLYKLYRRRNRLPRASMAPQSVINGDAMPSEGGQPDLEYPPEVDVALWGKFLEIRAQKIESETQVKSKAAILAAMSAFLTRSQGNCGYI